MARTLRRTLSVSLSAGQPRGGRARAPRLGLAADALDTLGARLISIDRPGLGASDPARADGH